MCSLRHSLMGILLLSLLFLAACDGTKTTKNDVDQLPADDIAADGDLLTDDLIPDEEEPDEADIDTKTDGKPDGDKMDGDIHDKDTVDIESDVDEAVTDETITDEVITDEVITDEVVTDEVVTDDILPDEDIVPEPRRVACTNIPADHAKGVGANADGKFEQTWGDDGWEPATFECAWVCDKGYLKNGAVCDFLPVLYVKQNATGDNNGSSWANAFTDLSEAMDFAIAGQEIWVAAGVYTPTICFTSPWETCPLNPRKRTFTLVSGVGIYGGFAGTETARDDRDWTVNETILSGDFNGDDQWDGSAWSGREENAYHVVQVIWDNKFTADGILDGFTIRNGYANADDEQHIEDKGGGLCAGDNEDSADPIVRNCLFQNNYAAGGGGGASFMNMDPTIENCEFTGNEAGFGGGALSVMNGAAVVSDSNFDTNRAVGDGGAILAGNGGSLSLAGSKFIDNTAAANGGAVSSFDADLTVVSCQFTNNETTGSASSDGGAISKDRGTLLLTGSTFLGNASIAGTAAINAREATISISETLFQQNASSGSGDKQKTVSCRDGTLTIADTLFSQNTGTALEISSCPALVERTDFIGNTAASGAGVSRGGSGDLSVIGCRFVGNAAVSTGGFTGLGGAMLLNQMGGGTGDILVVNSVFDDNTAGLWGGAMMLLAASPTIVNCTFDGNSDSNGDALVFAQSNASFNNTILWDTAAAIVGMMGITDSFPVFTNCDVVGSGGSGAWDYPLYLSGEPPAATSYGVDGGGNIDADPLFVGSGDDPLALQGTSPCIDAGDNDLIPVGIEFDILGGDRIQNTTVDMGAYEQ